ncbi:hypothetical protein O6P43_013444 [Quillaja saponaria]|uniref:Uncharacterized protein n=1 Tax=Quillaja saponaria TaxID=32244 RepID=A0AAD7PQU5_QUISA|nr:hypothetical protein O6P43_013444 [Quillaja saponaria]
MVHCFVVHYADGRFFIEGINPNRYSFSDLVADIRLAVKVECTILFCFRGGLPSGGIDPQQTMEIYYNETLLQWFKLHQGRKLHQLQVTRNDSQQPQVTSCVILLK